MNTGATQTTTIANLSSYIKSNFNEIDFDKDGNIGRNDVLHMITTRQAAQEATLASAFLYHYRGNLATKEFSLNQSALDRLSDPKFQDKAQRTLNQLAKKADATAEVFPKYEIEPTAIIQGPISDPEFTTSLIALAASANGDERIRAMIQDTADGAHIVTFPGDPTHPIHVQSANLHERFVGSSSVDGSQFVTLLERAYSLHCQVMTITNGRYGAIRTAFELLFGSKANTVTLKSEIKEQAEEPTKMRNRQAILQALRNRRGITMRTPGTDVETSGYLSRRGVSERQARGFSLKAHQTYALVNYDENSRMVTICDASKNCIMDRNGFVQHEIVVPLSQFEMCFSSVDLEQ